MDLTDETWRKPDSVPEIKAGSQREFVVAVRRAKSGNVYSFAATYLSALRLQYQNCPKGRDNFCEECHDEGCETTGWFYTTGDDDDGEHFHPMYMEKGDEFLSWRNFPQWSEEPALAK